MPASGDRHWSITIVEVFRGIELERAERLPPGRRSIRLDRVQWRILDALDDPTTLASLIEGLGLGAFAIFDALYHLLDVGAVRPVGDDSRTDPND